MGSKEPREGLKTGSWAGSQGQGDAPTSCRVPHPSGAFMSSSKACVILVTPVVLWAGSKYSKCVLVLVLGCRTLIGSADKVLLVACLGGSLDAPAPVSRGPAAAAPTNPPSPRSIAAAGDEATAKMLRLLTHSQDKKLPCSPSKWLDAEGAQPRVQPVETQDAREWRLRACTAKDAAGVQPGAARVLCLTPAAEDAASKAPRQRAPRSPRGRDQLVPRWQTATASSKSKGPTSTPPKGQAALATPPRPRAAPTASRQGPGAGVTAGAARGPTLTPPRPLSQMRCRTLDSPARPRRARPAWQAPNETGSGGGGTATCSQLPLAMAPEPHARRAVSAFPALYRFDASAKQQLEEQYRRLVVDFQSFVKTQRTSGGGRRRPTLPGTVPRNPPLVPGANAATSGGAGDEADGEASATPLRELHAIAAQRTTVEGGDDEDLFQWPVPAAVLALSPNSGFPTPGETQGAAQTASPTPARVKACSTPGGHTPMQHQLLSTPPDAGQTAQGHGRHTVKGSAMASPLAAHHPGPSAAAATPDSFRAHTAASTPYGTPLEATPVRPMGAEAEAGPGASPGKVPASSVPARGSFLSSVSTMVARHQVAFKKHMTRVASSRHARQEAKAAAAAEAQAAAAVQAAAAAQAAEPAAPELVTPQRGKAESPGHDTPLFATPVGGAEEPQQPQLAGASAHAFMGDACSGSVQSVGRSSLPGGAEQHLRGMAAAAPGHHAAAHRRLEARLVHCCAELDNDADVKMWSWGGDEGGDVTAATAAKESPGRPEDRSGHVAAAVTGELRGEAEGGLGPKEHRQVWRVAGARLQHWLLRAGPLSWVLGRPRCLGHGGQGEQE